MLTMDPLVPESTTQWRVTTSAEVFADNSERVLFAKAYNRMFLSDEEVHPSFKDIPRFFTKTTPTSELRQKLRELARELHYQRKIEESVENSELETLWKILETGGDPAATLSSSSATGTTGVDPRTKDVGRTWLDYDQVLECRQRVAKSCPKFTPFLQPHVVLSLYRNDKGMISINTLFDLVMRQVSIWQLRLGLYLYDTYGQGELSESDMEEYIMEQINEKMPQLEKLDDDFFPTYVVYAARRFFFFLDRHRIRKIKIKDVLLSDVMNEFNELNEELLPARYEETNWFSVPYVTRIHGMYIALDTDANGLLSEAEFLHYGNGTLTKPFVKRLFQACQTYSGEVDYKIYLDFVLAKENKQSDQSIRFFARLLDADDNGKITRRIITRFWAGIAEHQLMVQAEPPAAVDICNEIFDMIRPKDPDVITVKELVNSGYGHTVCSMLSDVDGFFTYENRESFQAT
eukprot:m.9760 g.9760  ORF g.9760 m.9760 type:complete len:461 (+) comp7905_c0_seq1:168-1550(+)